MNNNKINVILVNPPITKEERYGFVSEAGGIEPPHGLCYLAGAIIEMGCHVEIIDALALNCDDTQIVKRIKEINPSIVGLTAVTATIHKAAEVAAKIKLTNKKIIIIIGGVHISGMPEETMEKFKDFDIGVIGEGEVTIKELINCINSGEDIVKVKGIIYRKNEKLFSTGLRDYIDNLDSLAFPSYELLPRLDKYYYLPPSNAVLNPSISMITSRGCPYTCKYCDHSVFSHKYRFHSPEYVVSIMENLKNKYGIKDVFFQDDTFILDEKRVVKMAQLMIQKRLGIRWSFHLYPDKVLNRDVLYLIKESGCWAINLGIESCSEEILELLGKKININKMKENLKYYKKHNFVIKGLFMIGNPKENEKTLKETMRCMKEMYLDDIGLAYFTPYPATNIFTNIEKYGSLNPDWKHMGSYEIQFVPFGLNEKILKRYFKKILMEFYLRPVIFYSYFSRINSFQQFFKYLKASTVLFKGLFNFI